MERNPDSLQEFYQGREIKEISDIEIEMKEMLDTFHKELDELIDKYIDE